MLSYRLPLLFRVIPTGRDISDHSDRARDDISPKYRGISAHKYYKYPFKNRFQKSTLGGLPLRRPQPGWRHQTFVKSH